MAPERERVNNPSQRINPSPDLYGLFAGQPEVLDRPSSSTIIYEGPSLGKGAVIRKSVDLGSLEKDTEVIHLTHQRVINMSTIRELLKRAPQLKTIELSKSQERLVGLGIKKILDEHGVQLRIGRVLHLDIYDEPKQTQDYLDKKKFWEDIVADPERSAILTRLKEYEFEEVEIVDMYLSNKPGGKRLSIREIADKFGLSYTTTQKRIAGLLCFLGMEYKQREPQSKARAMASTFYLRQQERAEKNKKS